ncbi:MAG: hypothetical protein ACKO6N_08480 [Myxococcota bacterium]
MKEAGTPPMMGSEGAQNSLERTGKLPPEPLHATTEHQLGRWQMLRWSLADGMAWATLLAVAVAFFVTLDEHDRMGRIDADHQLEGPSWACVTGYDARGACVLDNLLGGVHAFVLPGTLAALLTLMGGIGAGLLLSCERPSLVIPTRWLLVAVEAVPRLALLLLVQVLSGHHPLALGAAVGLTAMPGLAWQLQERIFRLQQKQAIRAARTHGLSEGWIVLHQLLWLECRGLVWQQALHAFAGLLLAEAALSFALGANSSPTEQSWGSLLLSLRAGIYRPSWERLVPFLAVLGAFLAVLSALWRVGDGRQTPTAVPNRVLDIYQERPYAAP